MGRTPLRNIRIDDATWTRWQAIAVDRQQPVTGLIREGVELLVASEGRPGPPPTNGAVHVPPRSARAVDPPRSARAVDCAHHVPPGSFCSRGCD